MTIMSYFGKNIKICFISQIPNIPTFKYAKFQPIIYFLSKVNFSERSKFGGKKSSEIAKTNIQETFSCNVSTKNKLNYPHPYVSPSSELLLSLKSFLTAMKQIFIYFFQSDEFGRETLTCQQI